MLYNLISTPCASADCLTWAVGRTLNPMIIARDAAASVTSVSVIAPTEQRIILSLIVSTFNCSKDERRASTEP